MPTVVSSQQVKQLAGWAIFLALLFALGWYKSRENQRDRLAMARWNREQNDFARNSRMELENVRVLTYSFLGKPGSKKDLERQLNAGQPFDLRRAGSRDLAEWAHPIYPFGFRLDFENGVLRGASSNRGDPAILAKGTARPTWPAWTGMTEAWRQRIVRISGIGWLIAFGAWCAMRRRRLVLSQILLATALTFSMFALVHPGYTITTNGMMSNDRLGLGAMMLIFTVYLLSLTLAVESNVDLSISQVRFRLRDLLVVVAVVASLLAFGPLGYVTLLAALTGVTLFAAVFHHYRSRLGAPRP